MRLDGRFSIRARNFIGIGFHITATGLGLHYYSDKNERMFE